ncbi:MAG: CPBP family intramembrane glutamic endopeptidase [Terracidiphilus sp.]
MTSIPEDEPLSARPDEPIDVEERRSGLFEAADAALDESARGEALEQSPAPHTWPGEAMPAETAPTETAPAQLDPSTEEPPMFGFATQPEPPRTVRIPHFGHLLMLLLILLGGFVGAGALVLLALHFRLYGISTLQGTVTEIHYTLGSEGLGYLFTLGGCLLVFPLLWNKPFFAGIQWNGATAARLRWYLVGAAFVCFLLALVNGVLLPGPTNTPIEKVFREPGAAWLLFGFGVTAAPFFEEMFFRGFLLPALCTACDWTAEKTKHVPIRPLAENGHPQWSLTAMAIASLLTSLPFAWMHAAQTGYSLGPFLLLVGVSVVLCAVRLWTRSLAASTLVHACYNFMLFSLMMVASHGFRHLDKI